MQKVNFENLNDFKIGKNFTIEGKCSNCGECCSRYLLMSSKEKKNIIRFCKKQNLVLPLLQLPLNFQNSIIATCPFRDDFKKECMIYPVRPNICRDFLCNDFPAAEKNKNLLLKKFQIIDMFDVIEICIEQV